MTMDERIVQLLTVGDANDPQTQSLLLPYFEEFKKQDEGWKVCGDILGRKLYDGERLLFFCLQVMEGHIKTRYLSFTDDAKELFKSYLKEWYKHVCASRQETFIKNKTAQLFCLIFVVEYPHKWLSIFHEMLTLLDQGVHAVDIYQALNPRNIFEYSAGWGNLI